MNYGLTEREQKAYGRAAAKAETPEWFYQLALTLLVLFCLAYCADNVFHLTNVAHAAPVQPVRGNAYYCQFVKAGEAVRGASAREITKLCGN